LRFLRVSEVLPQVAVPEESFWQRFKVDVVSTWEMPFSWLLLWDVMGKYESIAGIKPCKIGCSMDFGWLKVVIHIP
jgi:hypothetical protein